MYSECSTEARVLVPVLHPAGLCSTLTQEAACTSSHACAGRGPAVCESSHCVTVWHGVCGLKELGIHAICEHMVDVQVCNKHVLHCTDTCLLVLPSNYTSCLMTSLCFQS